MNAPDALSSPAVSSPTPSRAPEATRVVPLALGAWALSALGLALCEPFTASRAPLVPLTIAALTAAQVVAYRRSGTLRRWLAALDARWLVAWHVLRFPIGARFLQLASRGELPGPLALRAGYGDMAAGALALLTVVALTLAPRSPRARALSLAWNALALLDIIAVIASVGRVIFVAREAWRLEALMRAPGPLLPLFVVPTVIATHAYLFARLRGTHRAA